jgi:hypothetical protein
LRFSKLEIIGFFSLKQRDTIEVASILFEKGLIIANFDGNVLT